MTKAELRKIYLSRRQALSEDEYQNLSQQICEKFFETVNLSSILTLHIFLPITTKREPDTWFIINRLKKEFPLSSIVVPRVKGDEMEHVLFENQNQLTKNKWQIWEPETGQLIDAKEIELVLVPLLAFDEQGHRVGYGRGYYDRFLKDCRKDCLKIGISFFEAEKEIAEKLDADVMLDLCITPDAVYKF